MKRVIILLLAVLITLPVFSQELSRQEQKKLEKELKKEQKAEEAAKKAAVVDAMVLYRRFVLEANTLKDKRGNSLNVSSNINFIAADSLTGVIQVGSNTYIGSNGVGGVTVEGSISDYKYSKHEKSGSYSVSYYLRTPLGSYDVRLTVYSDGRADADVSSTTWGDRLRYAGYLVPPGISRVFKGNSL
ncbi:MAG: DUF4251 domain-containing protein [Bacteroidales bacterium]|nr:DUF4251 domain-containing protein [Bacteroidales bacterium]